MALATLYRPSRESELGNPVERLFTPEIVAVELKLRDWRRAVWQAVHNRQVATVSYIALPVQSIGAVDAGILRCLGLGLIGVESKDATIFLRAKRSQVFNATMADRILRHIR